MSFYSTDVSFYSEDFSINYCKECIHLGKKVCRWCHKAEGEDPSMFETFNDYLCSLAEEEMLDCIQQGGEV